jgi:hypothetical protein
MPDRSKVIAFAMVGITVVVILVGGIVLATMLREPASPACDNLKRLADGGRVVERLQRYLSSHGRDVPNSCRDTLKAVDREMEDAQVTRLNQCLTKAATADIAIECVVTIGGGLQQR